MKKTKQKREFVRHNPDEWCAAPPAPPKHHHKSFQCTENAAKSHRERNTPPHTLLPQATCLASAPNIPKTFFEQYAWRHFGVATILFHGRWFLHPQPLLFTAAPRRSVWAPHSDPSSNPWAPLHGRASRRLFKVPFLWLLWIMFFSYLFSMTLTLCPSLYLPVRLSTCLAGFRSPLNHLLQSFTP